MQNLTKAKWWIPVAVAAAPFVAFAAGTPVDQAGGGLNQVGGAIWGNNPPPNLAVMVGKLIGQALGLLGIVFVVLIMYAGFIYMTANGNDEKVKKAKKMIAQAIIGMVLMFSAYSIASFVVNAISVGTQGQ